MQNCPKSFLSKKWKMIYDPKGTDHWIRFINHLFWFVESQKTFHAFLLPWLLLYLLAKKTRYAGQKPYLGKQICTCYNGDRYSDIFYQKGQKSGHFQRDRNTVTKCHIFAIFCQSRVYLDMPMVPKPSSLLSTCLNHMQSIIKIGGQVSEKSCHKTRDAHFPSGNRETGNQGPGNFPREMEDQEKSGKNLPILGAKMTQKS